MTAYAAQSVDTVAPISSASQASVTQTSAAFALPSTSGAVSPCLLLETLQGATVSLFVKFGTSGAVTVSTTDGFKIPPGAPGKPNILAIPTGSTHIAIICDGAPCTVTLTGADARMPSFAPNGASTNVTVNDVTQAVAIPASGTGNAAVALVGLQADQIAWFIKFGTGAVTVSRTDGLKIFPGTAASPAILAVPSGATHFAILCEGPPGSVRVTGGTITGEAGGNAITNAMLADMAEATIKGRAVGAGTGDPQDLTAAQATAILDVFTAALKGLVPLSGGGTTNFLRADGAFAAPPSGGVSNFGLQVASSGTTVTFTNIPSWEILTFALAAMSHNGTGGANQILQIETSTNNGSSYSAAVPLTTGSQAAATSAYGQLILYSTASGQVCAGNVGSQTAHGVTSSSGAVNAVRFSWNLGGSFDDLNGTITGYVLT